jgi:hypothetical protein
MAELPHWRGYGTVRACRLFGYGNRTATNGVSLAHRGAELTAARCTSSDGRAPRVGVRERLKLDQGDSLDGPNRALYNSAAQYG